MIVYTQSDVLAAVKAAHPEESKPSLMSSAIEHRSCAWPRRCAMEGAWPPRSNAAMRPPSPRGIRATNVDVLRETRSLEEVARLVDTGGVCVPLECTFPPEAAAQALAASQAGHMRGKIVLTVA